MDMKVNYKAARKCGEQKWRHKMCLTVFLQERKHLITTFKSLEILGLYDYANIFHFTSLTAGHKMSPCVTVESVLSVCVLAECCNRIGFLNYLWCHKSCLCKNQILNEPREKCENSSGVKTLHEHHPTQWRSQEDDVVVGHLDLSLYIHIYLSCLVVVFTCKVTFTCYWF